MSDMIIKKNTSQKPKPKPKTKVSTKSKHGEASKETTHDKVAQLAYCLYQQDGSQDGHDERNWLNAEANVKKSHASDASVIPAVVTVAPACQHIEKHVK